MAILPRRPPITDHRAILLGFRQSGTKAVEQVFKEASLKTGAQFRNECGLGGPRRPKQKEVFARDQAEAQQVDDLVFADKNVFEGLRAAGERRRRRPEPG